MGTKVVIEARDLDTDVRERVELDVDAPSEEHAQRTQLKELVAAHGPGANRGLLSPAPRSGAGRELACQRPQRLCDVAVPGVGRVRVL